MNIPQATVPSPKWSAGLQRCIQDIEGDKGTRVPVYTTRPLLKPHKHPKANMDSHGVPDACPEVYFVSPLADVAKPPLCAGDPPVTEEQAQQAA